MIYPQSAFRGWASEISNKLGISNRSRSSSHSNAQTMPSAEQRLEQLERFSTHYRELLDIMHEASIYGPTKGLETRYGALRMQLRNLYLPCKPFVGAYLDTLLGEGISGTYRKKVYPFACFCDSFEICWEHDTLEQAIDSDEAVVMGRVTTTLQAMDLYRSHLCYLLAKTA